MYINFNKAKGLITVFQLHFCEIRTRVQNDYYKYLQMKSEDIKRIFILQGSIIDSTSVYAEDYDLANIFKTYTERNGKNIFFASYYQHI